MLNYPLGVEARTSHGPGKSRLQVQFRRQASETPHGPLAGNLQYRRDREHRVGVITR
jgi:hypothetical protein